MMIISTLNIIEISSVIKNPNRITLKQINKLKLLHSDLVHYLNLSIGMCNEDEINFYIKRALTWQYTLGQYDKKQEKLEKETGKMN